MNNSLTPGKIPLMAKVKEGDRVKIVTRTVTEQDKAVHKFFEHMQGLTGTVANVYNNEEIAVNVDIDALKSIPKDVHSVATNRMQSAFQDNSTENQRKLLTKEEMKFVPNYVILVKESDLEKA